MFLQRPFQLTIECETPPRTTLSPELVEGSKGRAGAGVDWDKK